MYQIIKHSGRKHTGWRILLNTKNRFKAKARFESLALKIRRGTIQLRNNDRIIVTKWASHLKMKATIRQA
jgi:hypothetical protein